MKKNLGMHRILILPDIRQDTSLDKYFFSKISNKFVKTAWTIIDFFCKHSTKHDLVTKLIFVHIFFISLFEEN
jgi:hypothetical protein